MLAKQNNLFLAPYEYDYIEPSNFYGIFCNGGRHDHKIKAYADLVGAADGNPVWEERAKLYQQAGQVLIDSASFIPLVHPITVTVVSKDLQGEGTAPNNLGFTPLRPLGLCFYTHVAKQQGQVKRHPEDPLRGMVPKGRGHATSRNSRPDRQFCPD